MESLHVIHDDERQYPQCERHESLNENACDDYIAVKFETALCFMREK